MPCAAGGQGPKCCGCVFPLPLSTRRYRKDWADKGLDELIEAAAPPLTSLWRRADALAAKGPEYKMNAFQPQARVQAAAGCGGRRARGSESAS